MWQIRFDLFDRRLECSMLGEALNELNYSALHFFFVLLLTVVGEDLNSGLGQLGYNLTDSEVTVVPKRAQG